MRKKYFTKQNIEEKTKKFKSILVDKNLIRENPKISSNTALLILDMQRYFLDPSSHAYIPSSDTIIPKINKLKNSFKNHEMPIIFTKHIDKENGGGMMPVWWKGYISQDNPLNEIEQDLLDTDSTILPKTQYDAFWETNLNAMLKEKVISTLVITGVMTHLCCESTARSAFIHGFNVIFTIDGTATYNEDHHLSSLINLAHGFAHIKTIDEIIELLS